MTDIHRLQVQVNDRPVGELVSPGGPASSVFVYQPPVRAEDAVSVTMPVQGDAYSYDGLHPIFAQNLPEGYLGGVLRKTISKLHGAGDLTLLAALGRHQIGRIALSAPSLPSDTHADDVGESLTRLLESPGRALFEELVQRYALRSGISGVQPKVMVPALATERASLKTEGFIVKSWGEDFPQLAANEYFCMMLAWRCGLPVPEFRLSRDGRLFVMKRFDRPGGATRLGFEDGCVLQGLRPEERYRGSYEKLARSLGTYLSAAHRKAGLRWLFTSVLVSWAVRNGDAHLKNFGVIYDQPFGERRLAPTYDIVSTVPYLSRDVPALTLAGQKVWWPTSSLQTFGRVSCELSARDVLTIFHSIAKALLAVAKGIRNYRAANPAFEGIGRAMEEIFLDSAKRLSEPLAARD